MKWSPVLECAAVAAVLLIASAAQGQESSDDQRARLHFEAGRSYFEEGNYEQALDEFSRAYDLSHRAVLLVNVANCQERLGMWAEAADSLDGFLQTLPEGDAQRGTLERRIENLRARAAQRAAETTAQAETTATTEATTTEPVATTEVTTSTTETTTAADGGGGSASPVPWIVAGGGAAIAVVGGVLMGVASSDAARVNDAAEGSRWADLQPVADGAQTMWTAGQVMIGVGAAVLAAGVVWGVVDLTSSGGSSAERETAASGRVRTRLRLGFGSVGLEGSF